MWEGKKAIFLGDSITEGVGTSDVKNVYWRLVGKELGMNVVGYGVSGTRIAAQKQEVCDGWRETFIERAQRMDKDADVVCVFGGTNDYGHGDAPIGTMEDRTEDTFYGALHTLFSYLCKTYPTAHIFVMTPLHRHNEDDPKGDGYWEPMLPLSGYTSIIRQVAEKYSLPIVDLYRDAGIQPEIIEQRRLYMPDGLHPNDLGNAKIARMVVKHLQSV